VFGMEGLQGPATEGRRAQETLAAVVSAGDLMDEVREILNALAGAEVDAEARPVDAGVVQHAGIIQGLLGGSGGEGAVDASMLPAAAVRDELRQLEILDLRGELRGKV